MVAGLVGWLVGGLVGGWVGGWVGWLVGWLVGRLVGWLRWLVWLLRQCFGEFLLAVLVKLLFSCSKRDAVTAMEVFLHFLSTHFGVD